METIKIPALALEWTEWLPWDDFKLNLRGRSIPKTSGVYEAKLVDSQKRLTIGKTSNLCRRIERGLVKGSLPHSAGKRIRESEDTSQIVIRWAETDRPACVEEELHRRYVECHGELPKYVKHS